MLKELYQGKDEFSAVNLIHCNPLSYNFQKWLDERIPFVRKHSWRIAGAYH